MNHVGPTNHRQEGVWIYTEDHEKTPKGVNGTLARLAFPVTL